MKTVAFYNPANRGDLHVSRELVRYVIENVQADRFAYLHRHSPRLLQDIPRLEQLPLDAFGSIDLNVRSEVRGDVLILSTWFPASPVWRDGSGFGCSLNTLYELFKVHLREHFNHKLAAPIDHFIPRFDFAQFDATYAARHLSAFALHFGRRVFVCNNQPLSGQTRMESGDFEQVLQGWIAANPSTLFVFSNDADSRAPNVAYAADVINAPAGVCDLPECGYVSTRCDVIVGRASGPYSYSLLADNLLDPRKTIVCFTDDERTGRWLYPTALVKARLLWSNDYAPTSMRKLLDHALGG